MSQRAYPTPQRPRRFLPEPIETSSRSHKKPRDNENIEEHGASHSSLCVSDNSSSFHGMNATQDFTQPSFPLWNGRPSTSRHGNASGSIPAEAMHSTLPHTAGAQGKLRRFTPQLLETARHSSRFAQGSVGLDGSARPQVRNVEYTDVAPSRTKSAPLVVAESPFSYSSLLRRQETRRHSFRVPDLPAIPSSGSEESDEPDSPEQLPCSDDRKHSGDKPPSPSLEYILPFPLHPSEKQLKEHALAAFPNEQVYQPVNHFAIDMGEEESPHNDEFDLYDPERVSRRASSADLPLELEHLRRHKEEAGMNRRHYLTTRGGHISHIARSTKSVDQSATCDELWNTNHPHLRQAASPPMLGSDLAFPQSLSPKSTIREGSSTDECQAHRPDFSSPAGLWNGGLCSSVHNDRGGLWHGMCKPERHNTNHSEALPPGLMTPRHGDEGDARTGSDKRFLSQTSRFECSNTNQGSSLDFQRRDSSDQEFNDDFVTQIYDYLSLGYPSIARYYDYELSKVSGLPMTALRADDLNTEPKGHFGVHNITNIREGSAACMRWIALRLYIEEWARQNPQMLAAGRYHEGWGVSERKGSWAV